MKYLLVVVSLLATTFCSFSQDSTIMKREGSVKLPVDNDTLSIYWVKASYTRISNYNDCDSLMLMVKTICRVRGDSVATIRNIEKISVRQLRKWESVLEAWNYIHAFAPYRFHLQESIQIECSGAQGKVFDFSINAPRLFFQPFLSFIRERLFVDTREDLISYIEQITISNCSN